VSFRNLTAWAALAGALTGATAALGDEVACTGPLGAGSSEAALIEAYGKDNVTTGEVDGPEGSRMLATTVFPDDPDRRFEVFWWDEESRSVLATFSVPARDTAPGGLRLGMTPAEVAALNGGPFDMSGFDWDYGGYANLGEDSPLLELPGGCYPSIRFAPTKEVPEGTNINAIEGDVQVPSTEPLLDTLDARVSELWLNYPVPEEMEGEGEGEGEEAPPTE
jgi:hypothetical protein